MTMNKKELAEMEELRRVAAMAKALSWPSYEKPTSMTLEEIEGNLVEGGKQWGRSQMVARGYFSWVHQDRYRVSYGCSDGINHGPDGNTTSAKGMGRMFATKADALRAARIELTENFAETLAKLDVEIAKALSEGGNA